MTGQASAASDDRPRSFAAAVVAMSSVALAVGAILAWLAGWSIAVVFSLAYFAIALIPFGFGPRAREPFDPLEPYFGLALLLYLYSLSAISYVEETGASYYQEIFPPQVLRQYAVSCLVGVLGFALGTMLYRPRRPTVVDGPDGFEARARAMLQRLLWPALLLVPFYYDRFNFLNVVSYADAALAVRVQRMADSAAGVKEVFLRDFPMTLIVCLATMKIFERRARVWVRVLSGAALASCLATSFLSGWRGQLVTTALIPVTFFHYRVRRLRFAEVVVAGVGVYVLVNALAVMRLSASIPDMFALLRDNATDSGYAFLKVSQSGELVTSANQLRLISGIESGETHYQWGGLLLSAIGSVVPRALWTNRPPLPDELFVRVFYPGVYESGGGYGFFIVQDGYWDFGLPGVLVYSALFALLVRWLYSRLTSRGAGGVWTVLYALLYGQLVLSSVRSGVLGSVKAATMVAAPILLLLLLTCAVDRIRAARSQAP